MRKLAIFLILGAVLMALGVSAAVFTTPTSGGTMKSAAYAFNISDFPTTHTNVSGCAITCTSGLTASTITNGSTTCTNTTSNATSIRCVYNTYTVTDAADYACSGTCYNGSTTAASSAITSVTAIVDNTLPVCTHSQSSNTEYGPDQTWTVTGINATSATIQFGSNPTRTMIESPADTFTYTGNIPETIYQAVTAITSDGTNETTCTLSSVRINREMTGVQIAAAVGGASSAEKEAKKQGMLDNPILLGAIALVAILILKKKK